MTITEADKDELGEYLGSCVAPWLTYAVHTRDARMVADVLLGLDHQGLMALAVVLAERCPRPLMRPDDGHVDEVAVARACDGERMPLTGAERLEAARRLAAGGVGVKTAAKRLGVNVSVAGRLYRRVRSELEVMPA